MNESYTASTNDRRILIGVFVIALLVACVGFGIYFGTGRESTPTGHTRVSLATATALEDAVNSIYIEYGRIPDVGSRVTTNSPQGLKLLNILLGLDDKSDNALNSRAIKFLSVKEGKNHKNGLIYAADGNSIEGLFDPWGSPYTLEMENDYNKPLHLTIGSRTIELEGRRVAAFSPGPDKKFGTSDDVKTW